MSGWDVAGWVIAAVVVGGLVYGVQCWWWPYAACFKCDGAGKSRSPSGRAWRNCRRCKGSGTRVRVGRRVWTWLAGVKKNAVG